jgi:hypothetical protein
MAIHSGRGRRNQPDIILFTETQRAYSIGRELGTLLFSAKETIHKAAYPSSRRWIGFEEVSVQVDLANTSFRFRPERPDSDLALFAEGEGSFSFQNEVVLTLFRLPPMRAHVTRILSRRAKHPQGATRDRLFVVEHRAIEWGDMGAAPSRTCLFNVLTRTKLDFEEVGSDLPKRSCTIDKSKRMTNRREVVAL